MSYLHRDASGTGTHCDCAHFHKEVTVLVTSAPGLNLAGLGTLEKALELHHEHIKVGVGNKARAILKEGETAQRVLRVMHDIHQLPGLTCKGQRPPQHPPSLAGQGMGFNACSKASGQLRTISSVLKRHGVEEGGLREYFTMRISNSHRGKNHIKCP